MTKSFLLSVAALTASGAVMLAAAVGQGARDRTQADRAGLSGAAGALHVGSRERCVLGAAYRGEPDRHDPIRLQEVRRDRVASTTSSARPRRCRGIRTADRTPPPYPFDDTDLYKVIEGASYALCVRPDKEMEAYLAMLIQKIGAAQEPDGYLYSARTIDPAHPHKWSGSTRWSLEKVDSHELYDAGHLYEAAVAHYQATGNRALLDIALKTADLLDQTFGPGKQSIWPGHQITEMGLVKLYRATGEARYLNLAPLSARRSRSGWQRRRRARIQPVLQEGDRAVRGRGPRGAGDVHVFRHR